MIIELRSSIRLTVNLRMYYSYVLYVHVHVRVHVDTIITHVPDTGAAVGVLQSDLVEVTWVLAMHQL